MNKEYIEKKVIVQIIEDTKNDFSPTVRPIFDVAKILVKQTPAADVAEVRHGMWIDTQFFDAHYQPIYQCSICGKEVKDNHIKYHKYCLHCGAKMDGGRTNE